MKNRFGMVFFVAAFGLTLSACNDVDDGNDGGDVCGTANPTGSCPGGKSCVDGTCVYDAIEIGISGTISVHPISLAINTQGGTVAPTLTWGSAGDVIIQLVDPVDLIADPTNFTPLAQGPLDLTACAGPNCAFAFTDVDISRLSLGLLALVIDTRETPEYVITNGGVFAAGTAAELRASGADFDSGVLFAISVESAHALSALSGKTGAELIADGFMFGLMLDAELNPVSGVTVTPTSDEMAVVYLNDTFTGPGTATNVAGFFLGVGTPSSPTQRSINTSWTATGGGETWPAVAAAGTSRGTGFALVWLAE